MPDNCFNNMKLLVSMMSMDVSCLSYSNYIIILYIYISCIVYYIYIYIYPHTRVLSFPGLISVARVNEQRTTNVTRVLKAPGAEICLYIYIYIYIYITFINFDFEMFAIFFSILRLNFQYFSFLALGFISNYYYFISNGLLNTYDI